MNAELISVNGIVQGPGVYTVSNGSITFKEAPDCGDSISVMIKDHHLTYTGNGTNCTFTVPYDVRQELLFKEFMHQVWMHRDTPAVKDQIEKMKIVMELVR